MKKTTLIIGIILSISFHASAQFRGWPVPMQPTPTAPPAYGHYQGAPGCPPVPPPPSYRRESIFCDGNRSCSFDIRFVTDVRFGAQISHTQCVEKVNYGIERNYVWVKDGCRARFDIERYY